MLLRQPARQTLHPGKSQPKAIRKESQGLGLRSSHQPARLYCPLQLCKDWRSRGRAKQMPPAPATPQRAAAPHRCCCAASTGHRASKYLHRAGQGESKQGSLIYGPWQWTPWAALQRFRPLCAPAGAEPPPCTPATPAALWGAAAAPGNGQEGSKEAAGLGCEAKGREDREKV